MRTRASAPGRRAGGVPSRGRAALPALAAGLSILLLLPVASLLQSLQGSPIPLGVIPVGVLVGVVIYLALRRARRNVAKGVEIRPMHPNPTPTMPEVLRKAIPPARTPSTSPEEPEWSEGPAHVDPSRSRFPAMLAQPVRLPQRRGYGTYVVQPAVEGVPPAAGGAVQPPPPGATGFGWKVAIVYAALAGPLLAISPYFMARLSSWFGGAPFPNPAPPTVPYFFSYYDVLVQQLGNLIFWPVSWPGPPYFLASPNVLGHTVADFIFTMYLVLMLAFLIASGMLSWWSLYTLSQRLTAIGVVLAYVVVSMFTEVFFFAIRPELAYSSLALLGRAFVGGLFMATLLFVTLVAPPVILVRPRFARRPRDVTQFFASALVSLALAFVLLFGAYELLGIGRTSITLSLTSGSQYTLTAFGLLLLLPLFALTIWALIGRGLYARELRRRPVLPVSLAHPPVSILIPAYNEEATIAATIRGADQAARLYPGTVEIVVGNDGSRDRTGEVAREAMDHLHHAHGQVLDLPHGGKSSALNGALKACRGDIVVRLDADTRLSPVYGFSAMVAHFSDPQVGGVQGLLLPLQKEGWTRKVRMLELVWNHLFLRRANYGTGTPQVVDGAFCAFRRQDILSGGGWVAWNGEDTEITYRLARMGFRFRYETRAVAYEDVPANYRSFKKQRIRWTRGGYFAHHRHYGSLFSAAPEFGGLAILYWLALFVRGGMRHLVYIYAVLMTFLLGLQTFWHILIILGLLLIPRGIVMAYYLVRLKAYSYLPWVLAWPVASAIKQFISMEGYGTILPGAIPEFSE